MHEFYRCFGTKIKSDLNIRIDENEVPQNI
jgi:hypothetical protein